MTRTFEEMCKARDPLYAAIQPIGWFAEAVHCERWMLKYREQDDGFLQSALRYERDAALLQLAIPALLNQGQPYYDVR